MLHYSTPFLNIIMPITHICKLYNLQRPSSHLSTPHMLSPCTYQVVAFTTTLIPSSLPISILFAIFPCTNLFTFPPISSFMWSLEQGKSIQFNDQFSFNQHSTAKSPPNTKASGFLGKVLIPTLYPPTSHKRLCASLHPYLSPTPEDSKIIDHNQLDEHNSATWTILF